MKRIIPLILFSLLSSCKLPTESDNTTDTGVKVSIAKWYNNHTAAITITHDDPIPYGEHDEEAQEILKKYNLTMDYELITKHYNKGALNYLKEKETAGLLSYFGHGNTHDDHDKMSYDEAYFSFKACFDTMTNWGLQPIAYAYPYGAGRQSETQQALKDAGFLSGRAFPSDYEDVPTFHIMPYNDTVPDNWFLLPSLRMEDIEFNNNKNMINDNNELVPILNTSINLSSWIILTYHAIGSEDSWGYTTMDNFKENVKSISEHDFWNASMNDITIYCYERKNADIIIDSFSRDSTSFSITISDGFCDKRFSHPLTVLLSGIHSEKSGIYEISQNNFSIDTIVLMNDTIQMDLLPNETPYTIKEL